MSYPPPSGPPNQGPPNGPDPGWQQPYQPSYQPQGGNWAALPYGKPQRKDKAVLIIVVIAILLAVILGIGGFVAYRLAAGSSGTAPAPAPSSVPIAPSPTEETPPAPPTTVPSATVPPPTTKLPTKAPTTQPVPSKPVGTKAGALALAGRFVGHLNAGNDEAAIALTCAETKQLTPILIRVWIKAPTSLELTDVAIGQDPYIIEMSGTTGGQKMKGTVIVQGSCVRIFQLSPA